MTLLSTDQCHVIFLVPTRRFPPLFDLQPVLVERVYLDKSSLPVLLHNHFETGR